MQYFLVVLFAFIGNVAQGQVQAQEIALSDDAAAALEVTLAHAAKGLPEGTLAVDPRIFSGARAREGRSPWVGIYSATVRANLAGAARAQQLEFHTQDIFTGGCAPPKNDCRLRAGLAGAVILSLPEISGDSATVAITTFADRGLGLGRLRVRSSDVYLLRTPSGWTVTGERVRVET